MLMSSVDDEENAKDNGDRVGNGNLQTPQCVGKFLENFRTAGGSYEKMQSECTGVVFVVCVPANFPLLFANSDIARDHKNLDT